MSKKIIFGGVVCLLLLALPSAASATTNSVEELQAMIAGLLKQVQELQVKLKQVQSNGSTSCHDFNSDLKIGDTSQDVPDLLYYLSQNGVGSMVADSLKYDYDETVASFVSAFQQKYSSEILKPAGLKYGTGYFGARTRAVLNRLYGCGVSNGSKDKSSRLATTTPQNMPIDPVAPLSFDLSAKIVSGTTQIAGESKVTYTISMSDSMARNSSGWTLQIICSADIPTNSKGGFECGETNPVSGNSVEISFMNGTGKYQTVSAIARSVSVVDNNSSKTATAKVELPPAY
jgi:hypothetical protein